jgi:hypothetical protein
MKIRVLEERECNLLNESLGGPFRYKIVDKKSIPDHANFKRLPFPPCKKVLWITPSEYKCLEPDCPVSNRDAHKKWMGKQAEYIWVREDVPAPFRDILAVHERLESCLHYSHEKIFPYELELARKSGVLEDYLRWFNKASKEVKGFYNIF